MSEPARLENPVRVDPARSKHVASPVWRFGADHWSSIAVITLAFLLWAPRFSGPIDLRWDAGVYYLLGTSLGERRGLQDPQRARLARGVAVSPAPAERSLPCINGPWAQRTQRSWRRGCGGPTLRLFVACSRAKVTLALAQSAPVGRAFALAAASAVYCSTPWTIFLSDLTVRRTSIRRGQCGLRPWSPPEACRDQRHLGYARRALLCARCDRLPPAHGRRSASRRVGHRSARAASLATSAHPRASGSIARCALASIRDARARKRCVPPPGL